MTHYQYSKMFLSEVLKPGLSGGVGGVLGMKFNIQSVTTILDVSSKELNWVVELIFTVFDILHGV